MFHHDPMFFLVVVPAALHIGMMYTMLKEWLGQRDEGFLLSDRSPLKGLPRINTMPMTDARRKRLHPKKVQPPKSFQPTVQKVREIIPAKIIPKLKSPHP